MRKALWLVALLGLVAGTAQAQQTGAVSGKVTLEDGSALPGVTVEASSPVLPQVRVTSTGENGEYRLPALPPGPYEVTFALAGMGTQKRAVAVELQSTAFVNVVLAPSALEEEIRVVAEAVAIDTTSTEIKTAIGNRVIDPLPLGQEYRDLVKLIPGVQYTEDSVRGPSAGGSGQDNVYQFDGVNVTLPLFGTLSAEPSSYDIDQISIVKGGAKAIDFNRSGGFTINSVSKSGTNQFKGEVSYQAQTEDMTGDRKTNSASQFDQDEDWTVASLGGPLVADRLLFYASYYRPTVTRDNRSNVYGEVPDFESVRDELFGKLSFTPTSSILLSGSYRTSEREEENLSVGGFAAASTSTGGEASQDIAIAEGSWVIDGSSFLTFKYTDFANETSGRPDLLLDVPVRLDGSARLNVNALDTQGLLVVPQPIAGQNAFNQFITPLIERYGYLSNGQRRGGGTVGAGSTINDQDFFRQSFQLGYDRTFGNRIVHDVHVGFQLYTDEEDLTRSSNGWGEITVPGGRTTFGGRQVFYQARLTQRGADGSSAVRPIHSEFESQSFEINDNIRAGDWSFNVGVLVSNDQLYGQDLRENRNNASGFELALGNRYKMYEVDWEDMIQPRLGVTWAYNQRDTVFASWARYNPAASSLPRAASWARNNLGRESFVYFDQQGGLIGFEQVGGSSGKFFQDGMKPRAIDEYLIGTSRQISAGWTARAYARYRYGYNFWEDTNNNARIAFLPPEGIARELYVPDLAAYQREVGGSSYVIAELDGAFTKFYEVSLESEWRGEKAFVRGSYVWSHYYGNFDQDNTTAENDDNIFVGSSFIADGAGRQLWDNRYGNLRGDRRHQLKVYGYYNLPWQASVGAFALYQSGQPWEAWNVEVYRALTTSTSDTSRFAEPAGSRRTDSHYQIDLNYTQNFKISRFNLQLRADLFNVTDNQTGYNIQSRVNTAGFGQPRDFYEPRRLQLALKFQF